MSVFPENEATSIDPEFYRTLEHVLQKDGIESVRRALRSLERQIAKHREKLQSADSLRKSSIERELRTFTKQRDTAQRFLDKFQE